MRAQLTQDEVQRATRFLERHRHRPFQTPDFVKEMAGARVKTGSRPYHRWSVRLQLLVKCGAVNVLPLGGRRYRFYTTGKIEKWTPTVYGATPTVAPVPTKQATLTTSVVRLPPEQIQQIADLVLQGLLASQEQKRLTSVEV